MLFSVLHRCDETEARTGRIMTRHGPAETPAFMPVGTNATVKAMPPADLERLGASIVLGNTYHLYLRPGDDLIASAGGLHSFMSWPGPILTDSGGFQVFSLSSLRRVDDDGITFRSHIDGSEHRFTPERVMEIQRNLGADILMCLDQCPALPAGRDEMLRAIGRTTAWAERCRAAGTRSHQSLFGIVQGGTDVDLRLDHLRELTSLDLPGYALGGLSVGESKEDMYRVLREVAPHMPEDRPRYLMGVGSPDAIIEAVRRGVDMLDSVYPTRIARHGTVLTSYGSVPVRNAAYARDFRPLDERCFCHVCRNFSRAYLRHLIKAEELLAHYLTTYHNLHFLLQMMREIREAVHQGTFLSWREDFWHRFYRCAPPE